MTQRPSRGAERVAEREREQRTQRLIVYGAIGVLLVAALVVGAGLYITQYLPPRAHVFSVGDRDFRAAEVVDRAAYLVIIERALPAQQIGAAALAGIDVLVNEELLRTRGPLLVGEVTAEDIDAELRSRPGLEGEDQDFEQLLALALAGSNLSREQFEAIVEAQIIDGRLSDHFREQLGESGPQIRLTRVVLQDRSLIEEVRAAIAALDDAVPLPVIAQFGDEVVQFGDVGWGMLDPIESFDAEIADAVRGLALGEVSAVVGDATPAADASGDSDGDSDSGDGSDSDGDGDAAEQETPAGPAEFYWVSEVDGERAYDEDTVQQYIDEQLREWFDEQREALDVVTDMSSGEEQWIIDHIISRVIGG